MLPWAHRAIVTERRWLSEAEFAEVLALCQFLPGPNIGNCAVVLGRRWFGLSGALVAFLGLFALPFVWVLGLAALYADYVALPLVRAAISGIGIAGAGLFIGTALRVGRPLARRPVALLIVAGCFFGLGVAKLSLFWVLPAALLAALLAARRGLV